MYIKLKTCLFSVFSCCALFAVCFLFFSCTILYFLQNEEREKRDVCFYVCLFCHPLYICQFQTYWKQRRLFSFYQNIHVVHLYLFLIIFVYLFLVKWKPEIKKKERIERQRKMSLSKRFYNKILVSFILFKLYFYPQENQTKNTPIYTHFAKQNKSNQT